MVHDLAIGQHEGVVEEVEDVRGGLVDGGSAERMRAAGADPEALLANNDSNRALAASGDLLVVGATGTNVADVQIMLLG